jgi:hypothetical protein
VAWRCVTLERCTALGEAWRTDQHDGQRRYLDNIFIERLWRSLKYEEVFIKGYGSVAEARRVVGSG